MLYFENVKFGDKNINIQMNRQYIIKIKHLYF